MLGSRRAYDHKRVCTKHESRHGGSEGCCSAQGTHTHSDRAHGGPETGHHPRASKTNPIAPHTGDRHGPCPARAEASARSQSSVGCPRQRPEAKKESAFGSRQNGDNEPPPFMCIDPRLRILLALRAHALMCADWESARRRVRAMVG